MRLSAIIVLALFLCMNALPAQETKKDTRMQALKEDRANKFRSDEINTIDLLQALEMSGINIWKFHTGDFREERDFLLLAEEYKGGELLKTDTLVAMPNTYYYFEQGTEDYFTDFLDQFKIITRKDDNKSELRFITYSTMRSKPLELEKTSDKQFFEWRRYTDSRWKPNQKVPLLIFASSWKDERYDFHRFCGVVNLSEGDAGTEELLTKSPHYILVSYVVSGQ